MPPLTGVRGAEEARALAVRKRPRVTRVTRARGRGASRVRFRLSLWRLVTSLSGSEARLRRRSRVDSLANRDGTKERGAAQPLRYSGNFFTTHADGTNGSCSTYTSGTSSSSREERERHAPSGPSEPILSDDDTETSNFEEAVSQHSESSESGDDDPALGSGSGDDDSRRALEQRAEMTLTQVSVQIQTVAPMEIMPQSPFL
ncbi:hypothetical protein CsSME_00025913 [Camellia sinensis var. sinensis]